MAEPEVRSGPWIPPTDQKVEPKKSYVLWGVLGAAGCFMAVVVALPLVLFFMPSPHRLFMNREQRRVLEDMDWLSDAILIYQWDHESRFPESLDELVKRDAKGYTCLYIGAPEEKDEQGDTSRYDGTKLPMDPWGNPYHYTPPGPNGELPELYSLGRDGKPGGSGLDEDLRLEVENRDI